MLSACSSLISIVDGRYYRVVQFSHFSVKEYLTSDRLAASDGDISRYHILPESAHFTLSQASLGVLLSPDLLTMELVAIIAARTNLCSGMLPIIGFSTLRSGACHHV